LRRLLAALAAATMLFLSPEAQADEAAAMRDALDRVAAQDWTAATGLAPPGAAADVVIWHRLRAGNGDIDDFEGFLARRADWPGLAYLRQKGEAAAARVTDPQRLIAYFADAAPATGAGALALARALARTGRVADAASEAARAWANLSLTAAEETALLADFAAVLAPVHWSRLDRLLWQGEPVQAARMLPRLPAPQRALAAARLALRADAPGVTALIDAVPQDLASDPGLAFERFAWRMRRDRTADAFSLIAAQSGSAEALGNPVAWAPRRAALARALLRDGKAQDAYAIASRHHLTAGSDFADLEFLAGFIALRRLNDPAVALVHFRHLQTGVATPISLARALYWQGRAAEAAGATEAAEAAYQKAARHQTAYYGLLAAEKLGVALDPALLMHAPPATGWRQSAFADSSVLAAARLLLAAGDRGLGKRFVLHLAESLDATELDQLADMALALNEPHVAVLIGKQAAERGLILPRAYFPVPDLVPDDLPVSRALALSIARRESEFDPAARSPADARGLMQVLPGTAKLMAEKLGLSFDAARLTRDPAYNVRLGAAYLAQLTEEFGPTLALIASGYNAGPGRPRRWITEFGDPRRPDVDVIDWVETIPFAETRTYVMRVAESVVIYRALLTGVSGPVRITAELKG